MRGTELVTVTSRFEVDCSVSDLEGVRVAPLVPERFRYVPGTSRLHIDVGGGEEAVYHLFDPDPPGSDGPPLPPAYDLEPNPDASTDELCQPGVDRQRVAISGEYEPGEVLGVAGLGSSLEVDELQPRVSRGASDLVIDSLEPTDDDPGSSPEVSVDSVYAGHLSHAGDEDYVRITVPGDIAPGSRLTVRLSHLPADYDLAVAGGGVGASRIASPWKSNPWKSNPWKSNPWKSNALDDTSVEPGVDAAILPPEGSQDLPFTTEEFRTNAVRGSSINRGLASESVTTTIRAADLGTTITVGIGGYNGAASDQPYLLDVSLHPAPVLPPCIAARDLTTSPAGALAPLPVPDDRQSLILIAPSRMPGLNVAQLEAFAARGTCSARCSPSTVTPR